MKLPSWFKIAWWILLLAITTLFLICRKAEIFSDKSNSIDIIVLLIFIALILAPLFSEIELFGFKLKQDIKDLKENIRIQLGDLRNEIRNTQVQNVHTTVHGYAPPPPDSLLPDLEKDIDRIIKSKYPNLKKDESEPFNHLNVPKYNLRMFQIRYNIEKEVRRIWETRYSSQDLLQRYRHLPVLGMINELTGNEIITSSLNSILRELLAICNYGIHGEQLTDNQIRFAENNAVGVIDFLRGIK